MFNVLIADAWWLIHNLHHGAAPEGSSISDWWVANSAKVTLIVIQVMVLARIFVKVTPSPKDDGVWNTIYNVLKILGIVIPTDPPEIEKAVTKVVEKKIEDMAVGETDTRTIHDTIDGGNGNDALFGFGRLGQRRPALRRQIRRIAARNGHYDLSDSDVDDVIDECAAKQAELSGGPLANLLEWIVSNPETVLKLIQIILGLFGEPKKDGAK